MRDGICEACRRLEEAKIQKEEARQKELQVIWAREERRTYDRNWRNWNYRKGKLKQTTNQENAVRYWQLVTDRGGIIK